MNEKKNKFTDAGVVVWLPHQSGTLQRSLTVRSVHETSSHRNYQTGSQHLCSFTGR